jgi:SAM-dependent methyltransferase
MAEVARVLRSNGRAVFSEPLGHNPLLWLFRRLTPAFRTPDEHPLLYRDLRLMRKRFGNVEIKYFHLISLAAIPFLWTGFFRPVYRFLEKLDQLLFKILPVTGLLAWYAVIDLQDPGAAQMSGQKQAIAKA